MTISATAVRFDEHAMWVDLSDGRTLGVPLAWFPRLLNASAGAGLGVDDFQSGGRGHDGLGLCWCERDSESGKCEQKVAARKGSHI